jgi:hypothetical protein
MKSNVEALISQVANVAAIKQVHVTTAQYSYDRAAYKKADKPLQARIGYRTQGKVDETGETLTCLIQFDFEGHSTKAPQQAAPLISMRVAFEVTYSLTRPKERGKKLSQKSVDLFTLHNAVFNVWPFWREFVLDALGRMGLPAYTVPLLRRTAKLPPKKALPDPNQAAVD